MYQDEPIHHSHEHSEGGFDEPFSLPHKSEQTHKGRGKLIAVIAAVTVIVAAAITIPLLLNKSVRSDDALSSSVIVESGTCGVSDNVKWTLDDNGVFV